MKYGAEAKSAVGERGVAAINDWSTRAGDDTDLYIFSHGAWISQTLQTLLGLDRVDPTFASVLSMNNAHWVRLLPMDTADGGLRWRLMDYNHGPAIADRADECASSAFVIYSACRVKTAEFQRKFASYWGL